MDIKAFNYAIELFGYPTEVWFRPLDLQEIMLNNESACRISPMTMKIKISPSTEMVYVKEAKLIRQSGVISNTKFTNSTTLVSSSFNNPYKEANLKLRKPKKGDIVKLVDINGKDCGVASEIIKVQKIVDNIGWVYTLANSNIYDYIIDNPDKKVSAYIVLTDHDVLISPFPNREDVLFYEKDLSERESDISMAISQITGFEFTYTPSNTITE